MKKHLYSILFCLPLLASIGACSGGEAEPVKYTAPEVSFATDPGTVSAVVGETVRIAAKVTSGDKVTTAWYIDGVLVSSSQEFEYVFDAPGSYAVRFEARNGAGVVERDYTVTVSDRLSIRLSVGDSTAISRLQLSKLLVAAIVESGSDVEHEWKVDGVVEGTEAFFGSYELTAARDYVVSYKGSNAAGSFEKSFTVTATERPLQIGFSVTDELTALLTGAPFTITATVLFGGTGLVQSWYLNGELVSSTDTFSNTFYAAGDYTVRYEAENAKGESVSRSWTVSVTATGDIMDNFESGTIGSWFNTGENQPGIQIADNPLKDAVNSSDKCLSDEVAGSGSTSGYFTLKGPQILSGLGMDISKYSGIRFKVYFNGNQYYPRVDYGGTKYPSVTPPKFDGGWEVLEYRLPEGTKFNSSSNIQFRMMYNEAGSNISGRDDATNNRKVYIDDIEFFE
ncbi:MAG: PKD domain-containing protein [Bacteroidales bacterium]|nr:PKD domain-containing protein [Bacteroidales bacterium]